MNILTLYGKNIVVTGASSGIGRQCAITLSQFGANIILIARDEKRLEEVRTQLVDGNHLVFPADITDYSQLEDIVSRSAAGIGKIAGFIHSAGIDMTIPLKGMRPSHYEKVFATNVIAGFELARLISSKLFLADNGASFIFISSVMGEVGQPGKIGYSSSKGALIAGARSMALELAPKKIRVNSVLPGLVLTEMASKLLESIPTESRKALIDMHPLGLGSPEDVSNLCLFLLSDQSKWITGASIVVDGGYMVR